MGLFLLLIQKAPAVRAGAAEGVQLMTQLLIPSLLPFFVAAGLLNRLGFTAGAGRLLQPVLGRLLHLSGSGCGVFLLGLSAGYPLGAAALGDMLRTGRLDRREARRLVLFCDNTGPAFAVGAVGAAFSHSRAGLFLWGVHVLSALLLGVLFSPGKGDAPVSAPPPAPDESPAAAFTGAVQGAVRSLLSIGGFVIFFSALLGAADSLGFTEGCAAALTPLLPLSPTQCRALVRGFLELSGGVGAMQGFGCSPAELAVGAFVLSWGGLCVHFQSMAVLDGTGLDMKKRLGGKLLQGVVSAVLAGGLGSLCF